MGFYSRRQLGKLGLAAVGHDVAISDRCSLYGAGSISVGDHVRIDDFSIVTARQPVVIGCYVHVSAYAFLSGSFGITVGDFSNVGIRATVLSNSDDFGGDWLAGPMAPAELRGASCAPVELGPHTVLGTGTVVLPGVRLGAGVAVGALSLVKESLPDWGVYAGIPARWLRPRQRRVEELARQLPLRS